MKYFEIAMSLIYLLVGILLLVAPPASGNFNVKYMFYIGLVLVVYGIARGYRVYKKYFVDHYEHENRP